MDVNPLVRPAEFITDTDAKSYKHSFWRTRIKEVALKKQKKKKYPDTCLGCCKTFIPLSYAVDEMAQK